ncbi:MAG: hypothetical protein K1X44_07050, partial [Alphaproteobacteria bacterium]|nr:hypothetical protein [Alphaproteobacteria bacterium]
YGTAGWISPGILKDGQVHAVWSYPRQKNNWKIKIKPFYSFTKKEFKIIEKKISYLLGDGKVTSFQIGC